MADKCNRHTALTKYRETYNSRFENVFMSCLFHFRFEVAVFFSCIESIFANVCCISCCCRLCQLSRASVDRLYNAQPNARNITLVNCSFFFQLSSVALLRHFSFVRSLSVISEPIACFCRVYFYQCILYRRLSCRCIGCFVHCTEFTEIK